MKKILNFILKPLFNLGILPKLKPTGYLHNIGVYIGEKKIDETEKSS
jgi:hypothetical protein